MNEYESVTPKIIRDVYAESGRLDRENDRLRDEIRTLRKALDDVAKVSVGVFSDQARHRTIYSVEYAIDDVTKAMTRSQDALCEAIIDGVAEAIRRDFNKGKT